MTDKLVKLTPTEKALLDEALGMFEGYYSTDEFAGPRKVAKRIREKLDIQPENQNGNR